jgi:hypothetical protein
VWAAVVLFGALAASTFGVYSLLIGMHGPDGVATAEPAWSPPGETASPADSPDVISPAAGQVATLAVRGDSQGGVQISFSKTGTYRFTYVKGAYAVWPSGKAPPGVRPWLTSVIIFKGSRAPFRDHELNQSDAILRIEDNGYSATEGEAETKAGDPDAVFADLQAGEIVTLIGVDDHFAYFDNPGEVIIELSPVH